MAVRTAADRKVVAVVVADHTVAAEAADRKVVAAGVVGRMAAAAEVSTVVEERFAE